jgi:hypothetical protein
MKFEFEEIIMKTYRQIAAILPAVLIILFFIVTGCGQYFFGGGSDVDTVRPNVSVTSDVNGNWEKDTFTLSGNCTDNVGVTSVKVRQINKDPSSGAESVAKEWSASISGTTWNKYFDLTADFGGVNGYTTLDVYAYDAAGNSANTRILLGITNKMSKVTLTNPQPAYMETIPTDFDSIDPNVYDNMMYFSNGILNIQGNTTTQLLPDKSITLNLYDSSDLNTSVYSSTIAEPYNTVNWSFPVDTTTLTDNRKYLVKLTAKDQAGIDWAQSKGYIYVLQSTDNPKSKITSPISGSVIFPASIAAMNCWDDDGLKYIYWYIGQSAPPADYTTWPSLAQSGTQVSGLIDLSSNGYPNIYPFTKTTPTGTGTYYLHVIAVDKNDKAAPSTTSVSFQQTTADAPVVSITGPDMSDTYKGTISVQISANGGNSKNVTEIQYRIEGLVQTPDTTPANFVVKTDFTSQNTVNYTINVNTLTYVNDTMHDVKIKVKCKNENNEYSLPVTVIYRADNTPPTLTFNSPGSGSVINGTQRISGTTSDWSTVKTLYIGYFTNCPIASYSAESDFEANKVDSPATPVLDKWYKLSSPSTSWSYDFDTTKITSGTISPYYLYVAAVDTVGNVQKTSLQYTINQDLDKPIVSIIQPNYSGSINSPWTTVSSMEKFGSDFLIMGTSTDDDGVQEVRLTVQLIDYSALPVTVVSTVVNNQVATGTQNWSYTLSGLAVCTASQYYKISTTVRDINGRTESGTPSYFIVSNEIPVIDIIWPSTIDPDKDQREFVEELPSYHGYVNDSFGTVISNIKDDIYWDNNVNNNHFYLPDSPKYFFGWENLTANDDTNNDGVPETPSITRKDFSESVLGIYNSETVDTGRAGYFRMIFKAKDPNSGGEIRKVELSYDGGSTWETAFNWNGSSLANQNTSKYAMTSLAPDGTLEPLDANNTRYIWFYADIDTTYLGTSQIIKIKVTDNNLPTAYFSISSIQLTFDNTAPTGSFVSWGTNDPSDKRDFSSVNKYFGGNADDGVTGTGVQYSKLYFWDNQGTAETPYYGSGTGTLTANVTSGIYKVTIPDLADISPVGGSDQIPDYMIKAAMYTPTNWRISDIYSEINSAYGQYPVDGKKLCALEVIDNAGNKNYYFSEFSFSEYPPSHDATYLWWNSMASGDKQQITDETTSGRKWISGNLNMSGTVSDNKAGDPAKGISRIRVLVKNETTGFVYATYSTEIDGNVEINSGSTLPTSNGSPVTWTLNPQATSLINGGTNGNYLIEVEVRDIVGVSTVLKQYVYIDNSPPTLNVVQPTNNQYVKGDIFTINGTVSDNVGFGASPVTIQIYDGATLKNSWNVSLSGNNWSQVWDLSAATDFLVGQTRTIKVTLTDKARNIVTFDADGLTLGQQDITVTKQSPPIWNTFTANGNSTPLDNSTFTALYPVILGSQVFIINGSTSSFVNQIGDSTSFTGAILKVSGSNQQTGADITGIIDTAFSPNTGTTVGLTNSYSGLVDGEYLYRAQLFQGAAEINMKKFFIVDNQKPHIWIMEMQNGDYVASGSTKYGHIDTQLGATGYTANTDAVSGVITVYVKAQDNYLLKNVQMRMTNYAFGSSGSEGQWIDMITRNSSGVWQTAASRGALGDLNYFKVTKMSDQLTNDKDYIYLKLEFNTANITSVAQLAQNLEFRCFDMAANESYGTGTGDVSGQVPVAGEPNPTASTPNSSYQKWARKTVDVVPYITNVTRSTDTERTRYGKFCVRQAETGLTIFGYNLANVSAWARVYTDASGAVAYDDVTGITPNATYTAFTSASLASVTHSGWLRLSVNGIEAINNVNNNTRTTNQENDITNSKWWSDADWNDDRYFWVWETGVTFSQSGEPEHPSMVMNASGTLYGSWSMYSDLYAYWATTSARYQIAGGYTHYDQTEWTDLAIGGTNPNDAHVVYLNNMQALGSWGDLRTYDYNNNSPSNAIVESLGDNNGDYNDGIDDKLFQFQNPRIALNGDENYISYYDSFAKCLKYAVTTNATATYVTSNSTAHNQYTVVDGADDYVAPPGNTNGNDVGLWNDILIDNVGGADVATPRPVIIYYSTADNTLKIARANGNPTIARPDNSGEWTKSFVFDSDDDNRLFSGYYVSAKMDSSGNIHVVCYRNSTGDLIYLYAPNVDGNGTYDFNKSEVVDRNGAVGAWCDIYLVGTTPYISYHNTSMISTFYGLKCAYKSGSNWEYGVVPLNTFVTNKRTSIVASTGNIEGRAADAAIGYASNYFEITFLKREE